jgi:hypothetical protein
MNDINTTIQNIVNFKNKGGNPQQLMQMLMAQNPQAQEMLTRLQNMAQGRNPQEFIMQLAKQNGVSEENLKAIMSLFGKR